MKRTWNEIVQGLDREELLDKMKELHTLKMLRGTEPWDSVFLDAEFGSTERVSFDLTEIADEDKTSPLMAAVDISEMLLSNPKIARAYIAQNQEDVIELVVDSKHVIDLLKTNPPKLKVEDIVSAPTGKPSAMHSYAYTDVRQKRPPIILYRNIIHAGYAPNDEFHRLVFVLVVTLLHEVSHYKRRIDEVKTDISPSKYKVAQSGLFAEKIIFGGIITVASTVDLHGGKAPEDPLRFQPWGSENIDIRMVSDDYLEAFINQAMRRTLNNWLEYDDQQFLFVQLKKPLKYSPATADEIHLRSAIGSQYIK